MLHCTLDPDASLPPPPPLPRPRRDGVLLSQGAAQCCVTGPAFEHVLGQEDMSVVEAIMGSVAVFARMRSHQKGQVVDMLGSRGLYQSLDAQPRHMPVSLEPNKRR